MSDHQSKLILSSEYELPGKGSTYTHGGGIALVDVSLFTATKTPRVSAAWSAGFHFSPFPSPYTSKAWSIPGHLSKAITNCPLAR